MLTRAYRIRQDVKFLDGRGHSGRRRLLAAAGGQLEGGLADRGVLHLGQVDHGKGQPGRRPLTHPDPYFRYAAAVTYILEKKYWQANLKDIGTSQALTMCTGSFRFTSFRGTRTSNCRVRRLLGRAPEVRSISLKVIVNEATRLLAMRQGELDGSFRISQDAIDQWKRLSDADPARTRATHGVPVARHGDRAVQRPARAARDRLLVRPGRAREGRPAGYGQTAPTMPPPEQWASS